ncbi:MAG: CoA transferase [Betaproteobacteria bacterium]|nr:CoA transferase [Betaproteobacteria bacterium]
MNAAPLAGIVVVELGSSVAAPFAGQVLGDMGAEIIKVEKPSGDDARRWGPPFLDGAGATFQSLNRNKQSVALDLRDDNYRERLETLILGRADVVLQNMRPGQVEELGLGSARLCAAKPSLIYCNLSAFGRTGPLAHRPGYDPLMQAFGGIMSVTGEQDRPPVRVAPSIVDAGAGMWAVIGILAALHRRNDTGRGGVIDVSLFETAASWMMMHCAQYLASGLLPGKQGSEQPGIAPYRAFRSGDGELVIAAGNDKLFGRLSNVLGHPQWADDARFTTNPDRVDNRAALYALMEPLIASRDSAHWIRLLDQAGVPCAPVQTIQQMLEHDQTKALGLLQPVPGLSQPMIGLPITFDGERPVPRQAPPALGEHNLSVFPFSTGDATTTTARAKPA